MLFLLLKIDYFAKERMVLYSVKTTSWWNGLLSSPPNNEHLFLHDTSMRAKNLANADIGVGMISFVPVSCSGATLSLNLFTLKFKINESPVWKGEKKRMNWTFGEHYTARRKWFLGLEGEVVGELLTFLPY